MLSIRKIDLSRAHLLSYRLLGLELFTELALNLTFFALGRFDLPIESDQILLSYVDLLIVCIELTAGLRVPLFGILTLPLSPIVV